MQVLQKQTDLLCKCKGRAYFGSGRPGLIYILIFFFQFKCCGVKNYTDWTFPNGTLDIPVSCCMNPDNCDRSDPPTGIYKKPCLNTFKEWLKDKIYIVGAVGIALAFVQVRIICLTSGVLAIA